jgi:formylglycine-generating enzyme required for sulfatase activity
MVRVDVAGGPSFCIDSTEVTRAHYKQFLDAALSPSAQPAFCAQANPSFQTLADLTSDGVLDLPVVQVDWCDALAFCTWAGKRLCGDLADGGPLPFDAAADPARSEWTVACSRNGSRAYPYGGTSMPDACNAASDLGAFAVGTKKGCQGGYDGIFDMVGNVTEWENACEGLEVDGGGRCADRGASYKYPGACSTAGSEMRTGFASDWGIRCCATPK